MPISVPVPDKTIGDTFTEAMWDSYIKDNINKLLDRGHRVLTVSAFNALTGLEDGDEAYLEVDSSNGIQWHLRYVSAEATYKWRFLGGPPMRSEIVTAEDSTAGNNTYGNYTTDGPSVTTPRAGDYELHAGAWNGGNGAGNSGFVGLSVGGTDPTAPSFRECPIGNGGGVVRIEARSAAVGASSVIKFRHQEADTTRTMLISRRRLEVWPVRII